MQNGEGEISAVYFGKGGLAGSIRCSPAIVPGSGQYILAAAASSPDPVLATALFFSGRAPDGFIFPAPVPETWRPGLRLWLRGPLGRGFRLPLTARRVALLGFSHSGARLLGLLPEALAQKAEITLLCDAAPPDLPEEIEIQPLAALQEICEWADFIAAEADREALPGLRGQLALAKLKAQVEILVGTPVPCGGMAECGVCAVLVRGGWKMACKDGPVFDLKELGE
jgi:dihydroorotate dehydrogenase electron transfer subunit